MPQGRWLYGSLDRAVEHCRRYTRQELGEKCRKAGFRIETVFTFNRVGSVPWFVNGKVFGRKRFAKMQLKIFDSFVWLWRIFDRVAPLPGLSIIAVAARPETPQSQNQEGGPARTL